MDLQIDSLCEMCANKEFYLVRIFQHSNWIRIDTKYLSVFSPNAGKYRLEKTPYLDTFRAVIDKFYSTKWENITCNILSIQLLTNY